MKQYATYLRVSTQRQGAHGLGISTQRSMCDNFIKQNKGEQVREFMDVESGTHRSRKGLWSAIEYCKQNGCSLVIAKLDRLARDVEFTFKVINTGIDIHFTDMPVVNSMILGVFASVAQYEMEMNSTRTKQALAAKKARGELLGGLNEKWQETYKQKTIRQRHELGMKRGQTKNRRFLEREETRCFIRIIKNVFPDETMDEDMSKWYWKGINTKEGNRQRVIALMRDYHEMDSNLFRGWDFTDDLDRVELQVKLATKINGLRRSIKKLYQFKEESKEEKDIV